MLIRNYGSHQRTAVSAAGVYFLMDTLRRLKTLVLKMSTANIRDFNTQQAYAS
jgi:hypothetical protein